MQPDLLAHLDTEVEAAIEGIARWVDKHDALVDVRNEARQVALDLGRDPTVEDVFDAARGSIAVARLRSLIDRITQESQ